LEEHLLENDILEDKEEDKILIWTYTNSCGWDEIRLGPCPLAGFGMEGVQTFTFYYTNERPGFECIK
jgi:hypothetical protein